MNPLISIITITYNAADVIVPTMQSVARQRFANFEHIIIDGASTDDTLRLANTHSSGRLSILSEPDTGLYDAMNKGLRRAKGTYVIFLNAGDSFASRETLTHYADMASDDVDIIYADTAIVNAARAVTGPRHLSVPERLTADSFSRGMLICHQAFMVRRSIAPAYDLSYRFSADYDWTVKCIKATSPDRCRNLRRVEIHYLSDGLTDKNHGASLRERFDIMRKHYGLPTTILRHVSFIPRMLKRKINGTK